MRALQADHGLADCRQVRDLPSYREMTDANPWLPSKLTDILGKALYRQAVQLRKVDYCYGSGTDHVK